MKRARSDEPAVVVEAAVPAVPNADDDEAARARTCEEVLRISHALRDALAPLAASPPPPAAYAYGVLEYAHAPWELYVRRYGGRVGVRALLLGMNPGPFGQVQTGIPFGDVPSVRDFLGVIADVGAPPRVCPKRPVHGFACKRREVSGQRLWGWVAAKTGGDAQRFFHNAFVVNYCPVAWCNAGGANITPDKLPKAYRESVLAAGDDALRQLLALLQPQVLIGVGAFAAARLRACAPEGARVVTMPHPSPASPAANKDWAGQADAALAQAGIDLSQWQ